MAIVKTAANTNETASATTLTVSLNIPVGAAILAVGVVNNNDAVPASVAYNGAAMTMVTGGSVKASSGGTSVYASLWYLVNPSTGSAYDAVILMTAAAIIAAGAVSYSGVNTSAPLGTAVTQANTTVSVITKDASSATGEMVIDVVGWRQSGGTLTVGADQTEAVNGGTTQGRRVGMSDEPGAATVTMSWTASTADHMALVAVPLKPGTVYTQSVAGALTSSGALTKKTKKSLAGALSFFGTFSLLKSIPLRLHAPWKKTGLTAQQADTTLTAPMIDTDLRGQHE